MLMLRIGENLKKRLDFDKFLPKSYIEIRCSNLQESLDYLYCDFFNTNKSIRFYDFENEEVRGFFYKHIDRFAESGNLFFIDELSLNKATEDKLIREINKSRGLLYDARLTKEEIKVIKDEDDNPFFFIDYCLQNNKEKAWKELMRIKDKNFAEHEILGAFLWKASFVKNKKVLSKIMYIVSESRSEKTDINVYDELEKLSLSL